MKKRKKWLVPVLGLVLAGVILANGGSSKKKSVVSSDGKTETVDSTAANPEEGSDSGENTKTPEKVTIEEQVLVDHEGVKITALGYETDKIWGDGVKLLIENHSDKKIMVGCSALIVNDCMISDLFACEVAPGKKANETMHLSSNELKAAGIDTVGQIEIYFHIYESDNISNRYNPDCVTIKTSAYDQMDTTIDAAGTELYNENGIRIVGKTVDENSFWGKSILVYCENTSGKNVTIHVDDLSINGFMMKPYFSTTVYNGKKSLDDITLMKSDLEKNNITEIKDVELKFRITDADSYKSIAESKPITFQAQ